MRLVWVQSGRLDELTSFYPGPSLFRYLLEEEEAESEMKRRPAAL